MSIDILEIEDMVVSFSYNFSIGNNFFWVGYLEIGSIFGGPGKDGYSYQSANIALAKDFKANGFKLLYS